MRKRVPVIPSPSFLSLFLSITLGTSWPCHAYVTVVCPCCLAHMESSQSSVSQKSWVPPFLNLLVSSDCSLSLRQVMEIVVRSDMASFSRGDNVPLYNCLVAVFMPWRSRKAPPEHIFNMAGSRSRVSGHLGPVRPVNAGTAPADKHNLSHYLSLLFQYYEKA